MYMCGKYREVYTVLYSVHAHGEAWQVIKNKGGKGDRVRLREKRGDFVRG